MKNTKIIILIFVILFILISWFVLNKNIVEEVDKNEISTNIEFPENDLDTSAGKKRGQEPFIQKVKKEKKRGQEPFTQETIYCPLLQKGFFVG